jgi:hypothetical protein
MLANSNVLSRMSTIPKKYLFSQVAEKGRFNILFFGTDIIAKTVLEALYKNQTNQFKIPVIDKLEVVTSLDQIGRRNVHPVKMFATEKKIRTFPRIFSRC